MIAKITQKAKTWLLWSQKYTQADMVYLAKGSFWQTFGQVTNNILSFLLVLLFANFLPKETYGLYRYILSVAGILNVFTLSGMNQAVAQAVAAGNDGVLKRSVRYQLKWNLLATAAFLAVSGYYFLHHNWQMAVALLALSFFSPATAAFNTYGAYLEGKRNFRLNNIFSILSTIIYVAGMAIAILVSGKIIWLVLAYTLAALGANIMFYFATIRKYPATNTHAGETIKYGRTLTFISFFGSVVSQADNIILNHFWGPAQLAVYSIAMAVPNRAIPLIKGWVNIGFPKFSTKTTQEIDSVFYKRILQGLLVGSVIALVYVLVVPYLFRYLMPRYIDATLYSQLLGVSFIFAMPNRYISLLFAAQKLSRLIFVNSIIQNTIRVALYLVLGILGGIMGLVVAQLINSGVSLLINITMWRNKELLLFETSH